MRVVDLTVKGKKMRKDPEVGQLASSLVYWINWKKASVCFCLSKGHQVMERWTEAHLYKAS